MLLGYFRKLLTWLLPLLAMFALADAQGSSSFLKERTKKLLPVWLRSLASLVSWRGIRGRYGMPGRAIPAHSPFATGRSSWPFSNTA